MKITDLDEQSLLCGLIVGEAAGEDFIGKLAVACVVRNRVNDIKRWANDYKGVILQPKQFECFNDIPRKTEMSSYHRFKFFHHMWSEAWWRECWAATFLVRYNWVGDIVKRANHYHVEPMTEVGTTGKIHEFKIPYWAENVYPVFKWGRHWFYKL